MKETLHTFYTVPISGYVLPLLGLALVLVCLACKINPHRNRKAK